MRFAILTVLTLAAPVSAADPPNRVLELLSEPTPVLGLPLPESEKPVYRVSLTARVDGKSEGTGVLVLDPTVPAYDELGSPAPAATIPSVKLDCSLKLAKTLTVKVYARQRPGDPNPPAAPTDQLWKVYAVTGPKITSRLLLAVPDNAESPWYWARLLVHDDKGKVRYVVEMRLPPQPEPCHPGCFPAGTQILRPDGTTAVEKVAAGDVVTTIGADGTASRGAVESVFVTTNRLVEVKTTAGALTTTETQPLALVDGGLRGAGELKAGDRIWRWDGQSRQATEVTSVTATARLERVYNLVLKDKALFVAGGFLARSKPPLTDKGEPAQPR